MKAEKTRYAIQKVREQIGRTTFTGEELLEALAELDELEDELAYYQRNDKPFTAVKCKCGHTHNVKHGCSYCLKEENTRLKNGLTILLASESI